MLGKYQNASHLLRLVGIQAFDVFSEIDADGNGMIDPNETFVYLVAVKKMSNGKYACLRNIV